MYRHARVQVGLRASHFHRHAEALHHLVGSHAQYVHADDLLVDAGAYQLHQRLGLVLWLRLENAVVEIAELGRVHFDVVLAVFAYRIGLRQSAGADGLWGGGGGGRDVT